MDALFLNTVAGVVSGAVLVAVMLIGVIIAIHFLNKNTRTKY